MGTRGKPLDSPCLRLRLPAPTGHRERRAGAIGLLAVLGLSRPEVMRSQQAGAGEMGLNCGRTGFQRGAAPHPPGPGCLSEMCGHRVAEGPARQPTGERTALSFPALPPALFQLRGALASYRPLASASPSLWWGQWHRPHGAAVGAQAMVWEQCSARHVAHSELSSLRACPGLGRSSMRPSCLRSDSEPPAFRSSITSQLLSRSPPDRVKGPGVSPSATPAASRRWAPAQRLEYSGGPFPSLGLPHTLLLREDGGKAGDGGPWPGQKECG